jgi:two-component system, NarL family, nitrate/nitrite response regulator NarL
MQEDSPTTLLLIDENGLMREGLKRLCETEQYACTVVDTPDQAVDMLRGANRPKFDVIIAKCAARAFDGQKVRMLHRLGDDAKFVILSDSMENLEMLTEAYELGADAYLFAHASPQVFMKSLELVMLGERVFPPRFVAFMARETIGEPLASRAVQTEGLSPRETEILRYLSVGNSNKIIANKLQITEGTVKVHMKAITRKLGVSNRTQAAIWALSHGLGGGNGSSSANH